VKIEPLEATCTKCKDGTGIRMLKFKDLEGRHDTVRTPEGHYQLLFNEPVYWINPR
jgi:hypothetical protein